MKHLIRATLKQICLVVLALVMNAAGSAKAQENTFETRLDVRGEYSDNIAFERVNPRDDIYLDVEPSIAYKISTERLSLNSKAAINIIRYSTENIQDRENQDYLLDGKYNLTERLSFNGNVSYRTDTTQETELLETGEVTTRQNRDRYIGRGGISWRFSELSEIEIDYNYLKKEFERKDSVDYDRHSISLSYNRYVNSGLDILSVIPAYEYRSSVRSELSNYSLSIGWRHEFSETFLLSISAGGRYTEQVYENDITVDNSGYIADARIKRTTEVTTSEFGYNRSLHTDVGGGETEVDQVYLNLNRKVLRRLRVGMTGRLYFRKRPDGSSKDERTYFQVRPTLNYRLTEFQNLELGYMYSNQHDRSFEDDPTVDRNSVWIVLKLRYDKIW